jgi:Tfp pilus assembly protein PilV
MEGKIMSKAERGSQMFEDVFQNIRKTAEANLKLQQEALQQWTNMWPGIPSSQPGWVDKAQKFHKQWCDTVSGLAAKHREVMDQQYQATVESLDAALKVTESTNPEEFRRRSEQFCRKAVDCVRDISETQVREFQESAAQWSKLVTQT